MSKTVTSLRLEVASLQQAMTSQLDEVERLRENEQTARKGRLEVDRHVKSTIRDRVLEAHDLHRALERIASASDAAKPPQVFLRADRGLDYGRVMRVMGELNRAGLNRVALVTVEEGEQ